MSWDCRKILEVLIFGQFVIEKVTISNKCLLRNLFSRSYYKEKIKTFQICAFHGFINGFLFIMLYFMFYIDHSMIYLFEMKKVLLLDLLFGSCD